MRRFVASKRGEPVRHKYICIGDYRGSVVHVSFRSWDPSSQKYEAPGTALNDATYRLLRRFSEQPRLAGPSGQDKYVVFAKEYDSLADRDSSRERRIQETDLLIQKRMGDIITEDDIFELEEKPEASAETETDPDGDDDFATGADSEPEEAHDEVSELFWLSGPLPVFKSFP